MTHRHYGSLGRPPPASISPSIKWDNDNPPTGEQQQINERKRSRCFELPGKKGRGQELVGGGLGCGHSPQRSCGAQEARKDTRVPWGEPRAGVGKRQGPRVTDRRGRKGDARAFASGSLVPTQPGRSQPKVTAICSVTSMHWLPCTLQVAAPAGRLALTKAENGSLPRASRTGLGPGLGQGVSREGPGTGLLKR